MDIVWGTVLSKSYVAVMTADEHAKLKEETTQLVVKWFPHMGDSSLEPEKRVVEMPYNTDIAWVEKRSQ